MTSDAVVCTVVAVAMLVNCVVVISRSTLLSSVERVVVSAGLAAVLGDTAVVV